MTMISSSRKKPRRPHGGGKWEISFQYVWGIFCQQRKIGKGVDTWPPGWAHTSVSLLMTRVSYHKGLNTRGWAIVRRLICQLIGQHWEWPLISPGHTSCYPQTSVPQNVSPGNISIKINSQKINFKKNKLTCSEGQGGEDDRQQVDGDRPVAEDLPPRLLEDRGEVTEDILQVSLPGPKTKRRIWKIFWFCYFFCFCIFFCCFNMWVKLHFQVNSSA